MQWIDRTKLRTELLTGTFLNLGSMAAAEIAAGAGFDWLLIDLEHGSGCEADLRHLLTACRGSASVPLVRLRSIDRDAVKFVMDSGAGGIMFPFVGSADEARRAVDCMKYPPMGTRGAAGCIRATGFGRNWKTYFEESNDNSLVIVQIETQEAVAESAAIAEVPGVDVLFVGPLDLSVSLGCPGDFANPRLIDAMKQVVRSCDHGGKTAGILTKPGFEQMHKELGFRFVAAGSDSGAVVESMQTYRESLK
jgi:4-hydroxy-2-oxoheptanedioate aldolase